MGGLLGVRPSVTQLYKGGSVIDHNVVGNDVAKLTGGDWVMAIISFFLTPLIPIILAIYNFARGRRAQGMLYLGVIAVQFVLVTFRIAAS